MKTEISMLQDQVTQLNGELEEAHRMQDFHEKVGDELKSEVERFKSALDLMNTAIETGEVQCDVLNGRFWEAKRLMKLALQANPSFKTAEKSEVPNKFDQRAAKARAVSGCDAPDASEKIRINSVIPVPCEEVKEPSAEECLTWLFKNNMETWIKDDRYFICNDSGMMCFGGINPLEAIRNAMKSASY